MSLDEPIVFANWFAVKTSHESDLVKVHSSYSVNPFSRGWCVPTCKRGEDYSADVSANDFVAVQENARAICASVSNF